MTKYRYDMSRVSRELLEKYALFALGFDLVKDSQFIRISSLGQEVVEMAKVPLRTTAEVDADIAKAVRDCVRNFQSTCPGQFPYNFDTEIDTERGEFPEFIKKLLSEETSD